MARLNGRTIRLMTIVLLVWVSTAHGLTNEERFSRFNFNFNSPGARSISMGGAFISIADDATASEANPAGLTILKDPEISGELKVFTLKTEFPFESTGLYDPDIKLKYETFGERIVSPSFISLVYPVKGVTFSFYRQELVRFRQSFYSKGAVVPGSTTGSGASRESRRFFPVLSYTELDIVNTGVSAAFRLSGTLSAGASVRFARFDIDSSMSRYDHYGDLESSADFAEKDRIFTMTVNDSESQNSFNAGLLWRPHSKFSLGVVYRSGPEFNGEMIEYRGPAGAERETQLHDFVFKVPDSYGVGVSYRPTELVTLSFDVVRIEYSDLLDDLTHIVESRRPANSEGTDAAGEDTDAKYPGSIEDEYVIHDGMEFHVGAEKVFITRGVPVALRIGAYTDPAHGIEYTGDDEGSKILFPGGETVIHYTFGLGAVLKKVVQLDLAGNISENSEEVVISTVYMF